MKFYMKGLNPIILGNDIKINGERQKSIEEKGLNDGIELDLQAIISKECDLQ